MSIQGDIIEIKSLKHEIKILQTRIKKLREKTRNAENRIKTFLKQNNQPGVKYKGTAILAEKKIKRKAKRVKDKEADSMEVLKKYGINNAKKVLEEILEARRGVPEQETKLKFKVISKNEL